MVSTRVSFPIACKRAIFIEVGLCCRCLLALLPRFVIGGLSRLIYKEGEYKHHWEEPNVVGRLSRECCAIPSCPWGYTLEFHSLSHASLAPVVFQYMLGNLENYNEYFSSEQRKAKLQAALLWRFIASEMSDLSVMAAPCQGEDGKVPLMAGPQMCTESMVCALRCLKILCMNTVTFSLVVFPRSSESQVQFKQLEEYVSANSGMPWPFFLCQAEPPIIHMVLAAQIHPFNLLTHLVYVRAHPHALR